MENNGLLVDSNAIELGTNKPILKKNKSEVYEIMHMEKIVAKISANGKAEILAEDAKTLEETIGFFKI